MIHKEAFYDAVRRRRRGVPAHEDSAEAFLHDPREGAPSSTPDELAELLAEEFVSSATSGEEASEDSRGLFAAEEPGGTVVTSPGEVTWLGSERVRPAERNEEGPRGAPSLQVLACPAHLQHLHEAWIANEVAAHYEHALRGTLGAVASSAFLLKRRLRKEGAPLAMDSRIFEPLGVIKARIHDMAATMDTKLVVPRTMPLATLVLSDLVGALLGCVAVPEGVLLVAPDDSPFHVVARKEELELALYCLLENSVDAVSLKGGGVVRLEIRGGGKGHVLVEISDDGLGIRPDVLGTAWHPFFTTKPDHLGLGLGIAKQLAERLGGSVGIAQASGSGVVATLKLRAPEG